MENLIILLPVIVGPIFIILGLTMLKLPPKRINGIYGYRTRSSRKSQERWDFAQKFAAREMMRIGGLLMITSAIGVFYKPEGKVAATIAFAILIFFIAILLVRIEKAIKKRFSEVGE